MAGLLVLVKTGMVFGLLALVLFVLKKTNVGTGRSRTDLLEVRGSTRLSKSATLTAVRVDGRDLLLGVTDHTVTLLTSDSVTVEVAEPVRRASVADSFKTSFLRTTSTRASRAQVAPEAVAAALASLRGELPPRVTDGSVAAPRSDARFAEEQPCADPAVA